MSTTALAANVTSDGPAFLNLRAFNLTPGSVFLTPFPYTRLGDAPGVSLPFGMRLVAVSVSRDADAERVSVAVRRLEGSVFPVGYAALEFDLSLDYSEEVALVGLVVNPDDPDDSDLGTD